MVKVLQRLSLAAACVSLLVGILIAWLWFRSYRHWDTYSLWTRDKWQYLFISSDGTIELIEGAAPDADDATKAQTPLLDRIPALRYQIPTVRHRTLMLATAALPTAYLVSALVSWRRRSLIERRVRRGLCPACGYDLRSSTDVCPECGCHLAEWDR